MSARDDILARLTPTAGGSIAAEAAALLIAPERPAVPTGAIVDTFLEKLALPSVSASHDLIDDMAALPGAVARYLAGASLPATVYLPPDPRLDAADWSGIAIRRELAPEEPAVLALARAGVAETGSLVFETAPEAPMLPNFVALHHLVVLPVDAIVGHLEDALLPADAQPRAHYWVTGVSGTTDIEGTYVRGAHGPRFLHVILLRYAPPPSPRRQWLSRGSPLVWAMR